MSHTPEPTARILKCTAAEYHRDPCPFPSLSASMAHTLLTQSPEHARLKHPKLGGYVSEGTRAMDTGTLIHELLLGAGRGLQIIDAPDYRTDAAKKARDAATRAGKLPVLQKVLDENKVVVDALRERLTARGIRLSGASEVAVTWEQHVPGGPPIHCRCLIDHLILDRGVIYDLKTISSANPRTCAKHMYDYGYDIQWATNTTAVQRLRPELGGRIEFVFLFCELEPPYAVTPARPSGAMRQLGTMRWDRATELWAECLRSNTWPGYTDGIIDLDPPAWAIPSEMGSAA